MKCKQCGAELERKALICVKCGYLQENGQKLVADARDGDQDAISQLYNLTYNTVYRTVRFVVKDDYEAMDITQDSYVKAFSSLAQLREPAQFQAWLKQIAINTSKNWLKKKKPVLFTDLGYENGDTSLYFEDDRMEDLPDEVIDRKETSRLINAIMDELPEDQRLAAVMYYYHEMSVRDIAAAMGCSENTVKSRLNYARRKIELQVRKLAEEDTRLFSVAPVALLRLLLRDAEMQAAEQSAALMQGAASAAGHAAGSTRAGAAVRETARAGTRGGAHAAAKAGTHAGANAAAKAAGGMAAKAVGAKVAAGIVTVALLGGGVAAAVTNINKPDATPPAEQTVAVEEFMPEQNTQAEITAAPEPAPDLREQAYRQVLDNYASLYLADDGTFYAAAGTEADPYSLTEGSAMVVARIYGGSFLYTYYDVDHNGSQELLIGLDDNYNELPQPVGIYTFDGEKAVQGVHETALGERARLHILADGGLYIEGSSGYNSGGVELSRIGENGYTVERVFNYSYLVEDSGTVYYDSDGTETLSEEQFRQLMPDSTEVTDFDWQPLIANSDEPPQTPAEPETPEEPAAVVRRDPEQIPAAYESVIAQYAAACGDSSFLEATAGDPMIETDFAASPDYPDVNTWLLRDFHYSAAAGTAQSFYYAYVDIDGNGVSELLIGQGSGDGIGIKEVYTYDGQRAVWATSEPGDKIADGFTLYEDGHMLDAGFSPSARWYSILYSIGGDGFSLEREFFYYRELENEGDYTDMRLQSAKVPEQMYRSQLPECQAFTDINWQPLYTVG